MVFLAPFFGDVLGSKLPCFHIIGDGHQPVNPIVANSRGLYTQYKGSLLTVGPGGMTIPNIRSLDPGIYVLDFFLKSWKTVDRSLPTLFKDDFPFSKLENVIILGAQLPESNESHLNIGSNPKKAGK